MVDLSDGGDEHFCCITTEFFGLMNYILYTQNFPWYKLALHICTTTTLILFFNFIHKCFALHLGRWCLLFV